MSETKIIAFYLPQYHPIPENDKWWGKGFTDWINVEKAKPRFFGHYQPHVPAELGYYDLRNEETRIAQAELAEAYGVTGFCYYHYWFNEKILLGEPFEKVLSSGKPDFPFCLCWANENWTRRWDGSDNEILIGQNYDQYDAEKHFLWLVKAFSDNRYIKVNGKPLFLIYNTTNIPDLSAKIAQWRQLSKDFGFPGIFLCSVKSIHNTITDEEIINIGFDAQVDFIPNNETLKFKKASRLPKYYFFALLNKILAALGVGKKKIRFPLMTHFDYKAIAESKMSSQYSKPKTFPCIIPSWDNSARKKIANIIYNDNPAFFGNWLEQSIRKVSSFPEDERIVFINAWNEWAEGCHLEPDVKNGKMFLESILQVVKKLKESP